MQTDKYDSCKELRLARLLADLRDVLCSCVSMWWKNVPIIAALTDESNTTGRNIPHKTSLLSELQEQMFHQYSGDITSL